MEFTFTPIITDDAVVFGLLMVILALVFFTSGIETKGWKKFYTVLPALLLCYFVPSIFNSLGIISPEWLDKDTILLVLQEHGYDISSKIDLEGLKKFLSVNEVEKELYEPLITKSNVYFIASRYLLPTSLFLLTMSMNIKEIKKLGFKAVIMFFAATLGILIGGPLAILIVSYFAPDVVGGVGPDEVWRGLSTIAGSWIGGGANQAAMYELAKPSGSLYSATIAVDIIVANIWMAFLLFGVGRSKQIDKFLKADSSAIEALKKSVSSYQASIAKIPSLKDVMIILGIGFGATAIGHFGGTFLSGFFKENFKDAKAYSLDSHFFWLIILVTILGIIFSFTKARKYEGSGSSRLASMMIYVLVATIGMKMNILDVFSNPGLFLVGLIWMLVHVIVLLIVAKLIRAPYFFVAVGSQANVGGAASAPIVASAFHPSLAPVGVLLAVMGYAVGTFVAKICSYLMEYVSP